MNYTGGLYASDLFLEHVIPEIEASPAFKDGGLIDVTFDEAFPPFTYTGNSFANSTKVPPTAATSIASDSAARRCSASRVHYEPTGPNTPLAKDANGNELYPGPGDNAFLDRPATASPRRSRRSRPAPACSAAAATSRARVPSRRDGRGGQRRRSPTTRSWRPTPGASVTGTGIPAGAFVSQVTDTPTHRDALRARAAGSSTPARSRSSTPPAAAARRPAAVSGVDARRAHAGDRPAVRRDRRDERRRRHGQRAHQPVHPPGHASAHVYYNHYSWLRTMEDLFNVGRLAGPRWRRAPRLRGPARTRPVRSRRVQQPVRPRR